jgi:hypothetical protein
MNSLPLVQLFCRAVAACCVCCGQLFGRVPRAREHAPETAGAAIASRCVLRPIRQGAGRVADMTWLLHSS